VRLAQGDILEHEVFSGHEIRGSAGPQLRLPARAPECEGLPYSSFEVGGCRAQLRVPARK